EQLDKILAVRERTPGLRKIVVFDMEGLRGFSDPQVISLEELIMLGRARAREHPAEWEARIAMPKAGGMAIIVYTSGTTGPYKAAIGIGAKASAYEVDGKPVPLSLRIARAAADWLVLKNIRVILGLNRIRWAITGAAPISPDLIAWYWAMGVKMYEVYGQTENAGLATSNYPGHLKVGSIGSACPGTAVQVSPQGEI